MPHVVFSSPLTLPEIAAHFEPHHHDDDGLNIHFIDTFVNPRALLVETHVGEPTITQHVALLISVRPRPETDAAHEYTIHLSTVGQPRPTAGIHRAVQLLADWVLALHSENTLIKQKVSG